MNLQDIETREQAIHDQVSGLDTKIGSLMADADKLRQRRDQALEPGKKAASLRASLRERITAAIRVGKPADPGKEQDAIDAAENEARRRAVEVEAIDGELARINAEVAELRQQQATATGELPMLAYERGKLAVASASAEVRDVLDSLPAKYRAMVGAAEAADRLAQQCGISVRHASLALYGYRWIELPGPANLGDASGALRVRVDGRQPLRAAA